MGVKIEKYVAFEDVAFKHNMSQKIFHLVGLLGLHLDWDCVPEQLSFVSVVEDREDISEVSKD